MGVALSLRLFPNAFLRSFFVRPLLEKSLFYILVIVIIKVTQNRLNISNHSGILLSFKSKSQINFTMGISSHSRIDRAITNTLCKIG